MNKEFPVVENKLGTKMPYEIRISDSRSLRLLEPSDAQRIFEIVEADPDIRNHVGWLDEADTVEEIADRIQLLREQNSLRYGIIEDGVVQGYFGIWPDFKARDPHAYDMGYFLDKTARRRGLVTDAAKAIMQEASKFDDIEEFILFIRDENEESNAVASRLGFQATRYLYENRLGGIERRHVHSRVPLLPYEAVEVIDDQTATS